MNKKNILLINYSPSLLIKWLRELIHNLQLNLEKAKIS